MHRVRKGSSLTIVMFTIIRDQMTLFQGCSTSVMLDVQTLLDLIGFSQTLTQTKEIREEKVSALQHAVKCAFSTTRPSFQGK